VPAVVARLQKHGSCWRQSGMDAAAIDGQLSTTATGLASALIACCEGRGNV